jgi:hypothetical protein
MKNVLEYMRVVSDFWFGLYTALAETIDIIWDVIKFCVILITSPLWIGFYFWYTKRNK